MFNLAIICVCIIIRHIAMATKHIIFGYILENMTQVES